MRAFIAQEIGQILSVSYEHRSKPMGFDSKNQFLNQVISVETNLDPVELLKKTQLIERRMGRKTKSIDGIYSDRIADIDIILYGAYRLHTTDLTIPHPHYLSRPFVYAPLLSIAPEIRHCGKGKRVKLIIR